MIPIPTELTAPGFGETKIKISFGEDYRETHFYQIDSHIHSEGEIYVNISGDISFFCNGKIYPMTRGDVFIARPGDYHHCVYHSNAPHRHFWILFDYESNRHIWDSFFKTPFENVKKPTKENKEKLIELCNELEKSQMTAGERFYSFFSLLSIIKESDATNHNDVPVSKDFMKVLDYINEHISEKITVSDISEKCFVSISTLERNFMKYAGMKPAEYIRHKKLMAASEMLKNGESVAVTSEKSGYGDCSYFIEIFKSAFGMTPLQYKKSFLKQTKY
ncbi:MAG: helix-turn-helix transcriptional regulator [Clostridia bacterium]|nr:helix-turn-helix transcriptional regulator [Clostridia bacterium]